MLRVKQGGIKYHFLKVFGMTQPGIEPWSPGPLTNNIPTIYIYYFIFFYFLHIYMKKVEKIEIIQIWWIYIDGKSALNVSGLIIFIGTLRLGKNVVYTAINICWNNRKKENVYKERLIIVHSAFLFWNYWLRNRHVEWCLKFVGFLRHTTEKTKTRTAKIFLKKGERKGRENEQKRTVHKDM